jgi:hypothetical protein
MLVGFIPIYGQRDTLKAIYTDVVTCNIELITYSKRLDALPPGDQENLLAGINHFLEISDELKDTALRIFLYHQRKFNIFDNENIKERSFYDEYNTPIFEKINLQNKKLENYGFKLIIISHGYITTVTLPGFIESKLKEFVSSDLQKYLSYYTLQEKIIDNIYSDKYKEFVYMQGNSLYLIEELISKSNFCVEYLKDAYYHTLVSFIFYNSEFALTYGIEQFNIQDHSFQNYFKELVKENSPSGKTTQIISLFLNASKKMDKEELEVLFYQLKDKECEIISDCNCKNEYFNFDYLLENLNGILDCTLEE